MKPGDHSWKEYDHLVALYLYLYGDSDLSCKQQQFADLIGVSLANLKMCQQNFKAIETGQGLKNTSAQQLKIYDAWHCRPKEEFKQKILQGFEQRSS